MAKTLTAALTSQKNTLAASADGPWLWLVELHRDSTNVLYYADAQENVTFNSQTYTAMTMTLEPVKSDVSGSSYGFRVTVQNVDQTIITYLEAGELLGEPVVLTIVHQDHLSTATNKIEYFGIIISANATEEAVTFECGDYDLRKILVPGGRYYREKCPWTFKGDECTYAGGETSCDKRFATCRDTMSNESRYGGFPSMPIERP